MYARYFDLEKKVNCSMKVIRMVDEAVAKAKVPEIEIDGWKFPIEKEIRYLLYQQEYPLDIDGIVLNELEPGTFGEDKVNFKDVFCECVTPEGKTYTIWIEGHFEVVREQIFYMPYTFHTYRAYLDYAVKYDDCVN